MAQPNFEIYVASLTGKTIVIHVHNTDTIANIKKKIFEKEGLQPAQQRLVFKSKHLDENKPISHYGINAGSTLNLLIRLGNDKSMQLFTNNNREDDDRKIQKNVDQHNQGSNKNWYYLETIDSWRPLDRFIALMLCRRYNEKIRNKTFALFSPSKMVHDKMVRYVFQFNETKAHEMFEPQHCVIAYGYLDRKHMIQCDVPPNHMIDDDIELLYLLNTNKSANEIASAQRDHLSQLPHPSNPFLFGTWFAELICSFEWMLNEEIKLQSHVMKHNIDSLQFSQQYLDNNDKKSFKQMVKDKCGIPYGVGHLLYNYFKYELQNNIKTPLLSSYHICQVIHQFFIQLKHTKITEIQLIFFQNGIDSTQFFNKYLKHENPFIINKKLTHFLKHILSLKPTKIQQLIPLIKSAFQIRVDDKYEDKGDGKYDIDLRRAVTLISDKRNKPISSFHIWLPRNVIYSKNELIKQQNNVKRYIDKHNISSQSLRDMKKKRFVKELHSKCQIPIGPLNVLYDDLPTDDADECTASEVVEFIFNYLYELRQNNIERIRERCTACSITEEEFAKTIAPNSNHALAEFLRNTIRMKSNWQINHLIPKIQRYAQSLYPDLEIAKDTKQHSNDGTEAHVSTTFGTWLSELCFERSKLTKQQQAMQHYVEQVDIKHINEWEFSALCKDTLKLNPMDTAKLVSELGAVSPQINTKQLIERLKKILYDNRTKYMESIRFTCNALAHQGIDDEYFLHEIVVHDIKLEKFLVHNIGITQTDEIPQLIKNIRKHLEALRVIKSEGNKNRNEEEKQQTNDLIYGNKVGRWIGEIIHNRVRYLMHAKTVYDFIVVNHWDSGILPHIQQHIFIQQLRRYAFDDNRIYGELLREIWNRLERRYINNPDAFHAEPNQVAQNVFEYMREIRRAYVYQIAVECGKDIRCVDAKTFYTKIGSNKVLLRQFVNKVLKKTNQERLVEIDIFGREYIVEQIYHLLSMDFDDNNVAFGQWMSNMICDPVTLWLKITQIQYFLAEENVHSTRVKQWGKKTFTEKASKPCKSLNIQQLNLLYTISAKEQDKDVIFETISEKITEQHRNELLKYNEFISLLSVDKQSFLNVTAINVEKCIEFIDKDLGIKHDEQQDLVIAIVERLRLFLKIHTRLLDNQFNDKYEDAIALFSNAQDSNNEMKLKVEEKEASEYLAHSDWLQLNMLDVKEFNNYQLVLTLCGALLFYKPLALRITNIHRRCWEIIREKQSNGESFTFDGAYIAKYISSAKKQHDIDKKKQIVFVNKQIEKQTQEPWKYKQAIQELTANDLAHLVDECLLNTDCIPYYKQKMENIAQKIVDQRMSGAVFINNLKSSRNVFVHRMMQCFGDKSYHKLVRSVYDDIHTDDTLCDEIKKYDALKLSNYLKTYQTKKIKNMIIDSKINGKKFKKDKRYSFAHQVKRCSHLPLGVGTMLYKKMKTFEFVKPVTDTLQIDEKDEKNVLRNKPSIEFVSLIKNTLEVNDKPLCDLLWNHMLSQYDENKLQDMNQHKIIQFIYGKHMDEFSNRLLDEINHDNGNKYNIAKRLIQKNFKWFAEETKYFDFDSHFKRYIAEYFRSDLMLILIYKKKYDLLKNDDVIHFLWRLHSNQIYYCILRELKDNKINEKIANHRKGYSAEGVDAVMKEIKTFIKHDKKCRQNKKKASWKLTDIECHLMCQVLHQMNLMHDWSPIIQEKYTKLCIVDILFCIQYIPLFIEQHVQKTSNAMKQLMERKAKQEVLYDVNHDVIPSIVSNIFVSWVNEIIPDKPNEEKIPKQGLLQQLFHTFSS